MVKILQQLKDTPLVHKCSVHIREVLRVGHWFRPMRPHQGWVGGSRWAAAADLLEIIVISLEEMNHIHMHWKHSMIHTNT